MTRSDVDVTPVNGCRHCGVPERSTPDNPRYHAQQWTEGVGWHGWTQPTQDQIKARMLARRADRIMRRTLR
jgi:hypothetical protein